MLNCVIVKLGKNFHFVQKARKKNKNHEILLKQKPNASLRFRGRQWLSFFLDVTFIAFVFSQSSFSKFVEFNFFNENVNWDVQRSP